MAIGKMFRAMSSLRAYCYDIQLDPGYQRREEHSRLEGEIEEIATSFGSKLAPRVPAEAASNSPTGSTNLGN